MKKYSGYPTRLSYTRKQYNTYPLKRNDIFSLSIKIMIVVITIVILCIFCYKGCQNHNKLSQSQSSQNYPKHTSTIKKKSTPHGKKTLPQSATTDQYELPPIDSIPPQTDIRLLTDK